MTDEHDLLYELSQRQYWDIQLFGDFYRVQTRMEYDKETCEKIIAMVIRALSMK